MLSKVVNEKVRGSMFSFVSMFGSLGVLLANKLGGWMYFRVSKGSVFILSAAMFAVLFVLTLGLAATRKVRI